MSTDTAAVTLTGADLLAARDGKGRLPNGYLARVAAVDEAAAQSAARVALRSALTAAGVVEILAETPCHSRRGGP